MNKTKRQQLHNQKLITNYDIIHDNWFYDNIYFTDMVNTKIEDMFKLNKYNDIYVYERKKDYNSTNKREELIKVLTYFNKYHGYDEEFSINDFEALEPKSLKRIKINNNKNYWYPVYDGLEYKKEKEFIHNNLNCCCSQDCGSLYLIRNIKTDKYFGVGSICIGKFISKEFQNKINKLKKEELCKICNGCDNEFNKKNLNKIDNKQFCNKCIKSVKVIFDIKYKEKDEYKEYGIRWDSHNKYWYMNGVINQKLIDKIDKIEFEEQYNFIDED